VSRSSHAASVVVGQRLMQASGDVLLGWVTVDGFDGQRRDFYVRQLWDGKGSAEIETMSPKRMTIYAGLCGWTLARAHARTGDPVAITAYLGRSDRFDQAVGDYAELYADQNEADYEAVLTAQRI
jgi:sugar/nucleoside kinase (ribokinase family)